MSNSDNFNEVIRIIHGIDCPIVTHTNAPTVLCSYEFATACGTWINGQCSERL